jgi:hypothetical protein
MAVDVLVKCTDESHLARVLPDEVEWPEGDHDVDLEESLVALGGKRVGCLQFRAKWLGLKRKQQISGHPPIPKISPFYPLTPLVSTYPSIQPGNDTIRALMIADFLEHTLNTVDVPTPTLYPAYDLIARVRERIWHRDKVELAAVRAASAKAIQSAKAFSSRDIPKHSTIYHLLRSANLLGQYRIGIEESLRPILPGGFTYRRTAFTMMPRRAVEAALRSLAEHTSDTQRLIDETIWQRHHALRVYESLATGGPWPST